MVCKTQRAHPCIFFFKAIHSVSHFRLCDKLHRLFEQFFFITLGLFGSKLLRKIVLGEKFMIERLRICETQARISVILLARAPQG